MFPLVIDDSVDPVSAQFRPQHQTLARDWASGESTAGQKNGKSDEISGLTGSLRGRLVGIILDLPDHSGVRLILIKVRWDQVTRRWLYVCATSAIPGKSHSQRLLFALDLSVRLLGWYLLLVCVTNDRVGSALYCVIRYESWIIDVVRSSTILRLKVNVNYWIKNKHTGAIANNRPKPRAYWPFTR